MARTKIFIVLHSMYGHVHKVANAIKKGAAAVADVDVEIYRVPETLPAEVLTKMHASVPELPEITADKLAEADGFLFGIPSRYGMMSAQMKAFWDTTGGLWSKGALAGKPAGFFFSSATQHGGQETVALTAVTHLTHHAMIFVPLGYTHPALFDNSEVIGGSQYGSGTIANGDGSRQPSEKELAIAEHQGKSFAAVAKKLKA